MDQSTFTSAYFGLLDTNTDQSGSFTLNINFLLPQDVQDQSYGGSVTIDANYFWFVDKAIITFADNMSVKISPGVVGRSTSTSLA